jgi:hypothetical protein
MKQLARRAVALLCWAEKSRAVGTLLLAVIALQAFLVCLALRPWIAGDTPAYLELASNLSRGFYGMTTIEGNVPDVLRPPGYPILLWLFLHVLKLPVAAVVAIQVCLYLASLWLIDRWLARNGIRPFYFRLLAAAYPFAAAYSAFVLTEPWMMLALTAIGLIMAKPLHDRMDLAGLGIMAGVAIMFRTDLLLLPVLLGATIAWQDYRGGCSVQSVARRTALLLVPCALVLIPYSAWNQQHFGKFTPAPMAAAFGNSLFTAYWQEVLPHEDMRSYYNGIITDRAMKSGWVDEIRRVNLSVGAQPYIAPENPIRHLTMKDKIATSSAFGRAAIERIRQDPGRYVWHVTKNVVLLWNTSRYEGVPPPAQRVLMAASYVVFLLGMLGVLLTLAQPGGWPLRMGTALVMLYPYAVHLPGHLEARYTAAARPLLLMFAGATLAYLVGRIAKNFQSRSTIA